MTQFLLEDLQAVEVCLVGSPGWQYAGQGICAERQPCPHPQFTWDRDRLVREGFLGK